MITGTLSLPPGVSPDDARSARAFLRAGYRTPQVCVAGHLTAGRRADEGEGVQFLTGPLQLLDVSATVAAYTRAGFGHTILSLIEDAAFAAFPTHHFMAPREAQAWVDRLEYDEWRPDELEEDEDPGDWQHERLNGLEVHPVPTTALPEHLAAHAARLQARIRAAEQASRPLGGLDGTRHTLILTRPEDRDTLTALKDYLDFVDDEASLTVPTVDLGALRRTSAAGPALFRALQTPPEQP